MCNAHNHPPGCACGFGGESYQDPQWYYKLVRESNEIQYKKYDSYVNPNAICPVCGATVYYYQSPDGGRVYFDELGPPWPKHPCTSIDFRNLKLIEQKEEVVNPRWRKDGWFPLVVFPKVGHINFVNLVQLINGNDHEKKAFFRSSDRQYSQRI